MERDPLKNLLRWAKRRADKYDVPFNLTVDDIDIPAVCPVLGIPLFHSEKVASDNSPTLDRIVPEVGYVAGNVIVVSNRANRIKSNASWHEISKLAEFYEEHICQHWMKPTTIH